MSVYSWYGFADISFRKWVNLHLTGRQDQHSALPVSKNTYFYPSASLSAMISEMVTMPKAINLMKFRLSYARVGGALTSPTVGPTPAAGIYSNPLGYGSTYTSPYGGPSYTNAPAYSTQLRYNNTPAAYYTNTITNPNLEPSFSSAWETGIDVQLLQNRLGVDVTYFYSLDGPGIYNLPISETTGFTNALVNGISTARKGWEVVLKATPVQASSGFTWNVMFNWGTFTETIDEIYPGVNNLDAFRQVGERLDQIWGTGLLRTPEGTPIIGSDGRAIPLTSLNGSARRFLGYYNPDWTYGLTNTFSYKNFSLSILLDGRVGGQIEDYVQKQTFRGGRHIETVQGELGAARREDVLGNKAYQGAGVNISSGTPEIDIEGNITNPSELAYAPNANKTFAQDWVSRYYNTNETNMISRTFHKIREITLTYNLPSSLLQKTFIKRASVSVVGRNLFYFAEKTDMDIEQYAGSEAGSGLQTPTMRRYGINLNFTF
jgi:hypothetical protein